MLKTQQENVDGMPRLCAHRGLSMACPENTAPALAAAKAAGAAEVEFDLWMSADGVAVVCHDPEVDRTADGKGLIADMEWSDISQLDAGVKKAEIWKGIRIPRLEEVLDLLRDDIILNIHVKETGPEGRLVQLTCDLLKERGLLKTAYLASRNEAVLNMARACEPGLARALLFGSGDPSKRIEKARKLGCSRIQFGRKVKMKEEHFRFAQECGIVCNLFYSDDAREAKQYGDAGVDVVLTNCANVLLAHEGKP